MSGRLKHYPVWVAEIKIKVDKDLTEKFEVAPICTAISQAWK
jgi:hypothetical protein